jgi:hypothetical protein
MSAVERQTRPIQGEPSRFTEPFVSRLIAIAFGISLVVLAVALPAASHFSPDSWTVYELSRTIGSDFFKANTAREYSTGSLYSSAFAPLWPLIVALFTRFTGNIYGSYIAAFVAYGAFAIAAEALGRRAFGRRGIGLLSALLMLRFPGIRSELGGGRSLPLYLFELALLGNLLLGLETAARLRVAALGLLAGAMVMTRFDAMPAALVVLLGAPFLGVRRRHIALLLAGFAIAISPWVAYSFSHFHVPFATDNGRVAAALDPNAYVYDFHLRRPLSVADDPAAWVAKVIAHVRPIAISAARAAAASVFLPLLVAVVALGALEASRKSRSAFLAHAQRRALMLFVLATIAPITAYLVTGYDDQRYFTVSIWVAELFALGYVTRHADRIARGVVVTFTLMGALLSVATLRFSVATSPLTFVHRELDRSAVDTLAGCLHHAGAGLSDAVVFRSPDVVDPFKFGALTGWRVLPIPTNWNALDSVEREIFLRSNGAKFVVGVRGPFAGLSGMEAVAVACPMPLGRFTGATY